MQRTPVPCQFDYVLYPVGDWEVSRRAFGFRFVCDRYADDASLQFRIEHVHLHVAFGQTDLVIFEVVVCILNGEPEDQRDVEVVAVEVPFVQASVVAMAVYRES